MLKLSTEQIYEENYLHRIGSLMRVFTYSDRSTNS